MPIVDLVGPPRERGRAHGEELRSLIETGIAQWKADLGCQHRCSPDTYLEEFLASVAFEGAITDWAPDLLEEIRGVAEGARIPFETLYAYNLLDEEWWFGAARNASLPQASAGTACSTVGLRTGPNGFPLAAQNMDLPRSFVPTQAVLRVHEDDGSEAIVLTAAGIIGLCGCNSRGLGLCCNALSQVAHSPAGLPVAFVVRRILEKASIREARSFIESVPHASGQNVLLGDSHGLVDLECSANQVAEFGAGSPTVCHTNHPLANGDIAGDNSAGDSKGRFDFLSARAPEACTAADLQTLLSDRSVPLCKVETTKNSQSVTFGSLTMELSVPPNILLAPGPPDRTPWLAVAFSRATSPPRPPVMRASGR